MKVKNVALSSKLAALAALSLVSAAANAAIVGPDSFGYRADTSAAFSYEDVSGTGTQILGNHDDSAVSIPIGFNFSFYGVSYSTVYVSSNGILTFGSGNTTFTNQDLSSSGNPSEPVISPLWDDYVTDENATDAVYYQTLGSAPNRRLVVQWHVVSNWPGGADTFEFQAVLFENGDIEFRYVDVFGAGSSGGSSATVGIRNSTASGAPGNGEVLQISYNSASVSNNQTIRISTFFFQYSEAFTQGQSYPSGTSQCDNWKSFIDNTPLGGGSITASGSRNPAGYTCSDPAKVDQILTAMKNRSSTSVQCDGKFWNVYTGCGSCGGSAVSLVVANSSLSFCSCHNQTPLALFRPNIGNRNWGGIDGPTCNASSQTMTLTVGGTPAARDFGDAPAPYPTLLADGGASHVIAGPCLGTCPDSEADGQPSVGADGDDLNGADDEDGVSGPIRFESGKMLQFSVQVTGGPGVLDAWVDLNQDGDWDDFNEHFLDSEPVATGANTITVEVPKLSANGQSYVRFRISSGGTSEPDGSAADGEVEDYVVELDNFDEASFIGGEDNVVVQETGFGGLSLGALGVLALAGLARRRRRS